MLEIEMAHISIFIQPFMIDIEVFDIFYCIHIYPLLQQQQEVKKDRHRAIIREFLFSLACLKLKCSTFHSNSLEYVRICQNIIEYVRICKNMLEQAEAELR